MLLLCSLNRWRELLTVLYRYIKRSGVLCFCFFLLEGGESSTDATAVQKPTTSEQPAGTRHFLFCCILVIYLVIYYLITIGQKLVLVLSPSLLMCSFGFI